MSHGEKGNRPLRIAAEIRRELPDILRKHLDSPPDLLVSITGVEVSPDLSFARIFFSVVGVHERTSAGSVEHQLNARRGAIRTEIAHRLVMRQHPELKFVYDETPARAARIESLLKQIQDETRDPSVGKDE